MEVSAVKAKQTNTWLWLLILPLWIFLQTTVVQAASLPGTPSENYFDQTKTLDTKTENLVSAKNQQYDGTKQRPQIMLAVVKSTGSDDIDQYASDLFSKWGIGQKSSDNGILIVYAVNGGQRNVRIEVGYGLEDVITDSLAGQILTNNAEQLKSSSATTVNQGLRKTFNSVATLVDKHYGYKADKNTISDTEYQKIVNPARSNGNVWQIIVVIVIASFIFGRWGRNWPIFAWLMSSNNDHHDNDHFGGFGGFGSGSSGGGGFSGGGGSSGGGGASI